MSEFELTPETRDHLVTELREFFQQEWDDEISRFKAGLLLDFFMDKLAPSIYNQAVNDAHSLMTSRIEDILALAKRAR